MYKKAQVSFGETFGIIIIVYIIIVAGMMWYNNVNSQNIVKMQKDDSINKAFEKYYYVVNSDILHKTQQGVVDEEFDLVSLRAFSNFSNNSGSEYLRTKLGYSTVIINILNNNFESVENITIYNRTPFDIKGMDNFKTLIPIYDSINKTNNVAILNVIVY